MLARIAVTGQPWGGSVISAQAATQTPPRQANSFDSLRLLFAALVIVTHSYALFALADPLEAITEVSYDFGKFGVTGFFAISGYLVTQSWLRNPNPFRFVLARALRIVPAFWLALLFSMLAAAIANPDSLGFLTRYDTWQWLLRNALFIWRGYNPLTLGAFETNPIPGGANGSLWTLTYELYCYAVVFLLGITGVFLRPKWIWVLVAVLLVFYYKLTLSDPSRFRLAYHELYLAFVTAMLIALRGYRAGVLLLAIVLAYATLAAFLDFPPLHRWIAPIQVLIAVAVIRLANSTWLKHLAFPTGDYSYGLYVYAFPLQQLIIAFYGATLSPPLVAVLSLAATLPFAMLSWHCVEKRALEFVRTASKRWPVLARKPIATRKGTGQATWLQFPPRS